MTRRIKFLFGSIVLALGFLFCVVGVSVSAETVEPQPTTDEQVNVVGVYYVDEQDGKAEFTLYSNNTFSATAHDNASNEDREATGTYLIEGNIVTFDFENGKTFKFQISGNKLIAPQEEEQEEVAEDVKSAFAWFKSLDAESVKGWLIAIASYLGANILVLLALVIKLILSKTKEYKQTEFWNQVVAKMDQEHQEKVEKLVEEFNTKMVELQGDLKQEIAKLDDEKKEVARNNIAILKDNLNDIKEDLEK